MAQAVLHQIAQLLAPGCVPLFLSDGNPHLSPRYREPFWLLGAAAKAPGQRPGAQTTLDAIARAALRPGR